MKYGGLQGARFNGTANFAKTASIPEGYAPSGAHVLPIKAGGMAGIAYGAMTGGANLLQGGPMVGEWASTFTPAAASLGLIVSMSGAATITWATPSASLAMTLGMTGTGTFALTGSGGLSMIVPFTGAFASAFAGAADLKGRLAMAGEWTPYTELSPENLARAVWEALAAQYTEPGSMGSKLNTASSGGVDLDALAAAVWAYATRTVDVEKMNGYAVTGTGQVGDAWRAAGV